MEYTDEKLIKECKEYWNSGGQLDIEQFSTLKEFLKRNSIEASSVLYDIDKILRYLTDKDGINNQIISQLKLYYRFKAISNECYDAIISECSGNIESLNMEKFANRYPEYYKELTDENLRLLVATTKCIGIKQFESIIKAILPENLEIDKVNEKIKRIKYFYALNEIDSFSNGKSEEKLIEILLTLFDPDILFSQDKVGFSKWENEVLKKIHYMINEFDNIPEELTDRIEKAFNTKIVSDFKKVIEDKSVKELLEFDKYISYSYREFYKEDLELNHEDLDFIKEILGLSKNFTIEQLSQIQIFQDFTMNFIDTYKKTKDNEGIDEIAESFKMYLSKCKNPEDLLDKTIATITSLMNSEFLKEEDRNKLREIYEQNYLSKFQKENESRKSELQQKFPDLLEKVKNRESITAEELKLVKELTCIERTIDGFFKDEYIDTILKFELEKDIGYSENNNLIQRLLEDKVQRILIEDNIKDYFVINASPDYFINNIFDNKLFTGGYRKKNMIMLNEKFIEISPIITILNAIYHEVQHAKQFDAMVSKQNTNFLIYDMIKECKIEEHLGNSYYNDNYRRIKCEIDARIAANIKLVEFLQSLGINDEKIINAVQKDLSKDSELNKNNLRTVEGYSDTFLIDNLFQNIVEKDPSILADFEPFKIEFDLQTGDRRGNGQILLEYKKWCKDNKLNENQIVENEYADYYHGSKSKDNEKQILEKANLYAHILNNESYVYDTLVIDDMLLLPELMNTKSPKLRRMLDKIVRYEMLDVAYNYLKDAHIPEEVDMLTFEKAISNLEEYAQNIENDEFQEEILQIVSKIKEKDEFKQNEETNETVQNEINRLKKIAESTNKEDIMQGRSAVKQIKMELKREGKRYCKKDTKEI